MTDEFSLEQNQALFAKLDTSMILESEIEMIQQGIKRKRTISHVTDVGEARLTLGMDTFLLSSVTRDLSRPRCLIHLWATWCAPCLAQMPALQVFAEKYKHQVDVLGISIDTDVQRWRRYVEVNLSNESEYNGINGWSNEIFEILSIDRIPTYVLLDEDNNAVFLGSLIQVEDWMQANPLFR